MEFESVGSIEAFETRRTVVIGFVAGEGVFAFVHGALMFVERGVLAENLIAVVDAAAIFLAALVEVQMLLEALCGGEALIAVGPSAEVSFCLRVGGGDVALKVRVT